MSTIKHILNKIDSNDCLSKKESNIEDVDYFFYNYFNWLEIFINNYQVFSTDRWLAFPDKINKVDRNNINKISSIYEMIDNYAKDNSIFAQQFNYGYYYNIKCYDVYYKIGILFEEGAEVFCSQSKEHDESIDINDIIAYAKKEKSKRLVLTCN